jgi:hypothetical protein
VHHNSKSLLILSSASLLLFACKAQGPAGDDTSGVKEAAAATAANAATDKDGIHFNLAAYSKTKPEMAPLAALVAPGDAYLKLGDRKKFEVQTNASADGVAPPGVAPTFDAGLWVNAAAFNIDLGLNDKLVEVMSEANANPISLNGKVRYMGQEKLNAELTTAWEQTFARSLSSDAVIPTPIPGLGVNFGVNIGGEFGGKIDPSFRNDDAMTMAFIPRAAFNAGVTGGISTAVFLGAEAFGSVIIIETQLSHYAALGYHKSVGIAAGSLGIEDGKMTWLSGKVGLRAKTGASNLPAGINAVLWKMVTTFVPGVDKSWEHVLWEPEPLKVNRLPAFAKFMERFIKSPRSRSECLQQVAQFKHKADEISQKVEAEVAKLNEEYEKSKDHELADQMRAAATAKTNYQQILAVAESECATL